MRVVSEEVLHFYRRRSLRMLCRDGGAIADPAKTAGKSRLDVLIVSGLPYDRGAVRYRRPRLVHS